MGPGMPMGKGSTLLASWLPPEASAPETCTTHTYYFLLPLGLQGAAWLLSHLKPVEVRCGNSSWSLLNVHCPTWLHGSFLLHTQA